MKLNVLKGVWKRKYHTEQYLFLRFCDRRKGFTKIKVLILYMGVSIQIVIKWWESLMKLNVLYPKSIATNVCW